MIRATDNGVEIAVRVIPRAKHDDVGGTRGGSLLIRLTAAPVDGSANRALVDLLATTLGVSARSIQIVSGERSRDKRVAIVGVTAHAVHRALGLAPKHCSEPRR